MGISKRAIDEPRINAKTRVAPLSARHFHLHHDRNHRMLFARHAVAVSCAELFTTASAAPVPLSGEQLRQTHGSASFIFLRPRSSSFGGVCPELDSLASRSKFGRTLLLGAAVLASAMMKIGSVAAAPGDLDPAFAGGVAVVNRVGAGASGLVLEPDGKLVAVGVGVVGGSFPPVRRFALVRHASDGSLDPTFGINGVVSTAPVAARALARQVDGRLIAAGVTTLGGGQISFAIRLVRWNSDGSLDTSFGENGSATSLGLWPLDFLPGPSVSALIVQSNGKLTVAGSANTGGQARHLLLATFNPNGSIDTAFGSFGYVSLAVDGAGNALVQQPDGKLIVAGETADSSGGPSCMTLWRFQPDGSVDPSFGIGGRARACFGAASGANSLLRQNDGKLVAAGFSTDGTSGRRVVALARFMPDGSIDPGFGTSGLVRLPDRGHDAEARALAIQPDGKLVITGTRFTFSRFDADGTLDAGFGVGGVIESAIPTGEANDLAVQTDGRIVAAGSVVDQQKQEAMILIRVLGNAIESPAAGQVIEYINTANFPGEPGGHFFYTLDGGVEAQAVDSGSAGAFRRTGQLWKSGGTTAIARFYGSVMPGPNSHFYTLSLPGGRAPVVTAIRAHA